jgi:hypothetical protein
MSIEVFTFNGYEQIARNYFARIGLDPSNKFSGGIDVFNAGIGGLAQFG